jgi:hypothetical protein
MTYLNFSQALAKNWLSGLLMSLSYSWPEAASCSVLAMQAKLRRALLASYNNAKSIKVRDWEVSQL